jgi:phage tail protein X
MARSTNRSQNVNAGTAFAWQVSANTPLVHVVSAILDADAGSDHGGVVVKPEGKGIGVLDAPLTPVNASAVVFEGGKAYQVSTFDVTGWELLSVEVTNDAATSKDVSLTVYRA